MGQKVFSVEKFLESVGQFDGKIERMWAEECDNQPVTMDRNGEYWCLSILDQRFKILPEWIVEVEDGM